VSYEIDVASVTAVLLADGWHKVKGRSFGIEPYGYVAVPKGSDAKAGAGDGKKAEGKKANGKKKAATVPSVVDKGVAPMLGARWTKPSGEVIACPVGSVLALRHARVGRS
jgi:hypothetical protein